MSKTYFISDLHFNHKNILLYEPSRVDATIDYMLEYELKYDEEEKENIRDVQKILINEAFKNNDLEYISEFLAFHDKMLIHKWNQKVKKDDIVWFLGDLGMGNKEYLKSCVKQLNGNKKIILGNHDNLPKSYYEDCGFNVEAGKKRELIIKDFFVLSHHPSQWMNPISSPYFYIYGHVHSQPQYLTKTENSRCVCVERQNFEPIEIEEFNNYVESNEEIDPHKAIKENM